MFKIGVIGDKDSILGFKAVGMSVFPVTTPFEGQEILEKIAEENYAVIYITEHVAKDIVQTIDKYSDRRFPAIIPIPSNQGSLGIGMSGVKKSVERAVGADILFRDE
ncbi:MAG: V-type ATP synthase subunit F [Clostridiaceae bacterium]|jgi:V/A-type H+-transporting ATPase subunit F|nr:V-type ATP synthase subunit F [Clostridiaceae bacterium]